MVSVFNMPTMTAGFFFFSGLKHELGTGEHNASEHLEF